MREDEKPAMQLQDCLIGHALILQGQRDDLLAALEGLDAFMEFGHPLDTREGCVVAYSAELAAAFEAARAAIAKVRGEK